MAWFTKSTIRSRRREVRQNRKRLIASSLGALAVLLLAGGVFYGARREAVTISHITVAGGATVPHDLIEERVETVLSGTYALFIPRRFSFLFPREEIIEALNSIPRVHNANVVRSSRDTLNVSFEEYVPNALWCADASSTQCYFIDVQGLAYAEAPALQGETLVRFIREEKAPVRGEYVYDTEKLLSLRQLSQVVRDTYALRVRSITETKDHDLVMRLTDGVSLLMPYDTQSDDVVEKIASILSAKEFEGLALRDFEYIDVRFGNKVYVRKLGALEEIAAKEAAELEKQNMQDSLLPGDDEEVRTSTSTSTR